MSEISYCPVCGSENIRKMEIKPTQELTLLKDNVKQEARDYQCKDCGSNGDIDIVVDDRKSDGTEP